MPKKKFEKLWPAPAHTIAKIQILRAYFYVYLQILGTTAAENILYIDGFAGPGEYENDPEGHPSGSPVAAMEAALNSWRALNHNWKAGPIWLAFIEEDKERVEHLTNVLSRFDDDSLVKSGAVKYRIFSGSFEQQIAEVRRWCPEPFRTSQPLFAFIDPFGAVDVPFELVRNLLSSPCSEMLLNLSTYGATRIFGARKIPANEKNLDRLFDLSDSKDSWRDWLSNSQSQQGLCVDILKLYKHRLLTKTKMDYVFACEMAKTATSLDYYLVFASGHPTGMQRMKEAMTKIVKNGSYRFIDAIHGAGQILLFEEDDKAQQKIYSELLFQEFKGRNVEWKDLLRWALNESPFYNPRSMLKILQIHALIQVLPSGINKIRTGDFPPEKIASIEFAPTRKEFFRPKR